MVTLAPIQLDITSVPTIPPPGSPTVIGVIAGSAAIPADSLRSVGDTVSKPIAIRTLAQAEAAFGITGYAYETARLALSLADLFVVGVLFDTSGAAADVNSDAISAIGAMDRVVQETGRKPGVVIVPGFLDVAANPTKRISTYQDFVGAEETDANNLVTALQTVCEKIRAVGFAGGAGRASTPAGIVAATTWITNNGGPRILGVAQNVETPYVANLPGEIFLAANLARNDALNGISDSFSNRAIFGITSVDTPRSFEYFGSTSDAIQLRATSITSIVRDATGVWRVIGGLMRTANPTDPLRYVGVRRLVDTISERVVQFAVNRWNRNMTDNFIDRLVQDVKDYLGLLVSAGVLLRVTVGPDTVRNTPVARAAGLVYVAIQLFHPSINEQINFSVEVNLA